MSNTKVLIVDDSALVRDMIRAMIEVDHETEVVGEASNGLEAVEMVRELRPDIVTMDIDMPVMDGLQAIEQIMAENAVPILVVTSRGDAKTAFAAISKGALDLVVKPDVDLEGAHEFVAKLKLMSKVKVISHIAGRFPRRTAVTPEGADATDGTDGTDGTARAGESAGRLVAVASSTGGPDALSIILSRLPGDFPVPIVIAQHMSDGFVRGMVDWLMTISAIRIQVAVDGEHLKPGVAYFSPSENHMRIEKPGRIALVARQAKDIYRPSCDTLLSSVSEAYGERSIGVILTGMGSDGVLGIRRIKEAGGVTIAQDEATSIIFGMPRLAMEDGTVDRVLPIEKIGDEIVKAAAGKSVSAGRAERCT